MKILNRLTYETIFESCHDNIREALRAAIVSGTDMTDADLYGADLTGADLTGADLTGAVLTRTNLTGADLTGANLTAANLTGADLTGANLTAANLTAANLTAANLTDADLTGANLTAANLTAANLTDANLEAIKSDVWMILTLARDNVAGLRQAIIDGKIDGHMYEGECRCLVGTLEKCNGGGISGVHRDAARPAERWFLAIRPGKTPDNNQVSKITLQWIDEWIAAS